MDIDEGGMSQDVVVISYIKKIGKEGNKMAEGREEFIYYQLNWWKISYIISISLIDGKNVR